jgi:hypothetical protein
MYDRWAHLARSLCLAYLYCYVNENFHFLIKFDQNIELFSLPGFAFCRVRLQYNFTTIAIIRQL